MRETSELILKNFICPKLKPIRKSLGWTQARMAEELMMDVRSYIDLEHGESGCSALTLVLILLRLYSDPLLFLTELSCVLFGGAGNAA